MKAILERKQRGAGVKAVPPRRLLPLLPLIGSCCLFSSCPANRSCGGCCCSGQQVRLCPRASAAPRQQANIVAPLRHQRSQAASGWSGDRKAPVVVQRLPPVQLRRW